MRVRVLCVFFSSELNTIQMKRRKKNKPSRSFFSIMNFRCKSWIEWREEKKTTNSNSKLTHTHINLWSGHELDLDELIVANVTHLPMKFGVNAHYVHLWLCNTFALGSAYWIDIFFFPLDSHSHSHLIYLIKDLKWVSIGWNAIVCAYGSDITELFLDFGFIVNSVNKLCFSIEEPVQFELEWKCSSLFVTATVAPHFNSIQMQCTLQTHAHTSLFLQVKMNLTDVLVCFFLIALRFCVLFFLFVCRCCLNVTIVNWNVYFENNNNKTTYTTPTSFAILKETNKKTHTHTQITLQLFPYWHAHLISLLILDIRIQG